MASWAYWQKIFMRAHFRDDDHLSALLPHKALNNIARMMYRVKVYVHAARSKERSH